MGRIYNSLVLGTTANLPSDFHDHFMHCLDYVRQAVMCGGDIAVVSHEPIDEDEDEDDGPLDDDWNGHHGRIWDSFCRVVFTRLTPRSVQGLP